MTKTYIQGILASYQEAEKLKHIALAVPYMELIQARLIRLIADESQLDKDMIAEIINDNKDLLDRLAKDEQELIHDFE